MTFPILDLTGAKGVGRRKLDAVPEAFRVAFDPASEADDRTRGRACATVRTAVSGEEGAFTTAAARVVALSIDLLLGPPGVVARADLLAELALDLAYGDRPVGFAALSAAETRSAAAKVVRAVVSERLPALRRALAAPLPEARGLAAWLLLSAGAVDDGVVRALEAERDPGVRAALLGATAGLVAVDRDLLRRSMSPPAPVSEQAAAAAAWLALDGDDAPDAASLVLLLSRHDERPSSGYPWRVAAGRLGLRRVLSTPSRARSLVVGWLLHELEPPLAGPQRDRGAGNDAFGELSTLLHAILPQPLPAAEALDPLSRRAIMATTSRWFLGRNDFGALGLPETVAGRRVWLGLPGPPADPGDPTAVATAWAAAIEGTIEGPAPSEEEARAALATCPEGERIAWARRHLTERRAWPGATRAPNGASTLLALEQLDPESIDGVWASDHEPILAALSVDGTRPVELFGRIPLSRRPHVWRAWVALHPHPDAALREGERFAPACPTRDVALGLVALAARATRDEALVTLRATLDLMGEAGTAARARLGAIMRVVEPIVV